MNLCGAKEDEESPAHRRNGLYRSQSQGIFFLKKGFSQDVFIGVKEFINSMFEYCSYVKGDHVNDTLLVNR